MQAYDPDRPPRPDAWLAIDEGKRLELADAYHRGLKLPAPHARLHAAIHVVVENQLAIGETTVVETLARLRGEGLSRHEADPCDRKRSDGTAGGGVARRTDQ